MTSSYRFVYDVTVDDFENQADAEAAAKQLIARPDFAPVSVEIVETCAACGRELHGVLEPGQEADGPYWVDAEGDDYCKDATDNGEVHLP